MAGRNTFLMGVVIGLVVASLVYSVFLFAIPSALSDAIVSGTTLVGIGCALGGYFVQWRGDRSASTYLILGFGIGVVVIGFVGAGAGVSPYIGS